MNIFEFFSRKNKPFDPTQGKQPEVKDFSYKYLQHPFDAHWHHFSVSAKSQEEANVLATREFIKMFYAGKTVMTNFYPE